MARWTGGRGRTTGLGGAGSFWVRIYAIYTQRVLAPARVQPVDLPGFFARYPIFQGPLFPCQPLTPPPGSYTNLAVLLSLTPSVFTASPTSSKRCLLAAWEWCSRPVAASPT